MSHNNLKDADKVILKEKKFNTSIKLKYEIQDKLGLISLLHGISTYVGYLIPKPFL